MKKLIIALTAFGMLGLYSCDIEQKESGEMPTIDIDVETEAGSLPEYDVDWVNIDVGTTTKTITIPTVEIVMEEREVEVPFINAKWPSEYDVTEQTITVAAEVSGHEYDMEIEEVYASGNKLIVISSLERKDSKIGDKVMRVTDQIVVNAPDLSVTHYIIGDKPARGFNNNYTYVAKRSMIDKRLKSANKIYG